MSSGEGHKSKLSLHSSNQDKSSEKININIIKCKNLVIKMLIKDINES